MDYNKLSIIREHVKEHIVSEYTNADQGVGEVTYKSYIKKYLEDKKVQPPEGMIQSELIDYLYNAMREFSILTEPLNDPDVEEINVDSWRGVFIYYNDGSIVQTKYHFLSPEDALDIVRKLLRSEKFGNKLDVETPIVRGHLSQNKRITASQNPIIDLDRGVQANIRIINPRKLMRADFIEKGTASEEIYDFLLGCFCCGLSTVFIGATNTGKTTMMSSLLRLLPKNKRLLTIENEVREFNLEEVDEHGNIKNSVIHWVTNHRYDQEKLMEYALTTNPNFICLAEMKSEEAFAVIEACRTGHPVATTVHANSCRSAYIRMTTLCQLKGLQIDNDTLYQLCIEAFPIAVMLEHLDDNSRRITEITECLLDENRKPIINTLFKYRIKRRWIDESGKVKLDGEFVKVNDISEETKEQFISHGFDISFLTNNKKDSPLKKEA